VPPYFGVDTCAGAGVGAGVGAGAGVGVGVGLAQLVIKKAHTKRITVDKYSFFILPPENKKYQVWNAEGVLVRLFNQDYFLSKITRTCSL
jgi:hypothetical protein